MGRARAGHGQVRQSLSLMGTYLTPLSVPGTLQVLSSYCSVPALWRTSLWPLLDGNWSSAALGTEEPLPDNNQQQEGAPGHQGALEQPWSKPSWIGASAVTAGGPAGASSRSCSCSLHPRSIRSRQGRCWWLAGPWHPSPGLPPGIPPQACPPASPFPAASQSWENGLSSALSEGLVSPSLMGYSSCPGTQGLFPNGLTPAGVGAPGN